MKTAETGTYLFIDGQNFYNKTKEIYVKKFGIEDVRIDVAHTDFRSLFLDTFPNTPIQRAFYFRTRIEMDPNETDPSVLERSKSRLRAQTLLQKSLARDGIECVLVSYLHGHNKIQNGKKIHTDTEKGVDVALGCTMVKFAYEGMTSALLCSSDSDLLPAIWILHQASVPVTYVGFEGLPNQELVKNADTTVTILADTVRAYVPLIPPKKA